MVQHNPIREHGDFYQSNLVRKQLMEKKEVLQKVLSEENYTILEKHIAQIQKVFDGVVNVFKKMYGNGEFYFTYGEAQKFTDRKEFIDIFKNKVVFFSNTNKQLAQITSNNIPPLRPEGIQPSWIKGGGEAGGVCPSSQIIVSIPKIDNLITHIKKKQEEGPEYSCFIFSPKKEESKKIFEDLCKNDINKQALLLVENITGGIGKNIFKAKQTKNKILI